MNVGVSEHWMVSQHAMWIWFTFKPETIELMFLLNITQPNG